MALEDLCFHVSTVGTLRLPDPIHSAPGESTSSSTTLASPAPSFAGSSNESESTPTSIYCIDCDAHHIAGSNDLIRDNDDGFTDNRSCNNNMYPTCLHYPVVNPITGLDDLMMGILKYLLAVLPTTSLERIRKEQGKPSEA
jgi:hypothetical protein